MRARFRRALPAARQSRAAEAAFAQRVMPSMALARAAMPEGNSD